jgi:predicted nucleic acid-binding protein
VQPVIPGTHVASLLHRRKLSGPLATHLTGREPLITFITFGELAKWAEIRHWGAHRRGELAARLSGIPLLPSDEAVAVIWGRLSAAATRRARPRPVNDLQITAQHPAQNWRIMSPPCWLRHPRCQREASGSSGLNSTAA